MMSLKQVNPKRLCFMVLDVKPVDTGGHTGMAPPQSLPLSGSTDH